MEDHAYVLDYLPLGHPDANRYKREPVCYAIGENEFKILELIPDEKTPITVGDRVYIGKDMEKRIKIQHVKRRLGYNDLTHAAQSELPFIIEQIISNNPDRFLKFFNEAQAITTRFHMLELVPGLGKKSRQNIMDERKRSVFKDFQEMSERTHVHHPEKLIVKRIELELSSDQKYRLFVSR